MYKSIQENKDAILHNKYTIQENVRAIQYNKEAISALQTNYVSCDVFESTAARYDKIIHRLIVVLSVVIALLVISNALWIYGWMHMDLKDQTTVITQEGNTNSIESSDKS